MGSTVYFVVVACVERVSVVLTFSTKYPVPTSTITVSMSWIRPGTYSEDVNGTKTFLSILPWTKPARSAACQLASPQLRRSTYPGWRA